MKANRAVTAWLRPLAGLFALAAVFALSACGGGSGAPNNPYVPPTIIPPLAVLPGSLTLYPGAPASITIAGGTPPYQAFSSNSAVLPVTQAVAANTVVLAPNPVAADTDVAVAVTIRDTGSRTVVASAIVKPAPLLGALSVLPASNACGTAICSGERGSASVAARLPSGGPAVGVQIRFDVIYGAYALLTTNPASPQASTLTVVTDINGTATVGVQTQASASTQPAQIRATAVAGGQQLSGNFTITNRTVSDEIKVVPDNATIQSLYANECSSGFRVAYFVYGGNPPYRVSSSFPSGATLVNPTVAASGGFFEAITTGVCVDPLTFTIVDTSGKQTTAKLTNKPGSEKRPEAPPPPELSITPATVPPISCSGKSFQFTLVGGTPPYNVVSSVPGTVISPAVVNTSGGSTQVSGLVNENGLVTLTAVDSSLPKKNVSATIECSADAVTVPPLVVTPASIDSSFCTGSTFQFTASGGTPPYAVFSSAANITPNPPTITASGGTTLVSGLTSGSGTTTLSFLDSSSPQKSVTTAINCNPAPPPLRVSPERIVSTDNCEDQTFQLTVTGGTPPYTLYPSIVGPLFSPPTPAAPQGTVATSGGTSNITNLTAEALETTITVVDSNNPRYTASALIRCEIPGTPFTVTPGDYGSSQLPRACVGQTFNWAARGGNAPYDVRFSPPPPGGGVITPNAAGTVFTVSGLTVTGNQSVTVVFADSALPNNVQRRTIWCQ